MEIKILQPETPFHPITITLQTPEEVRVLLHRMHISHGELYGYFSRAAFGPVFGCHPDSGNEDAEFAKSMFDQLVSACRVHPNKRSLLMEYNQ